MLDVTRLRVLVAVARHGSVTAAAHALNYAQPSVSHHLARLEAETGTKLVQRAGRGIRLTDAGRLLAERAVEVIGRLDAVRRIAMEVPLAGIDVVEVAPPYDHAEVTGFLANRVVLEALSGIAWRRRLLAGDPAQPARRPESPLLEGRG